MTAGVWASAEDLLRWRRQWRRIDPTLAWPARPCDAMPSTLAELWKLAVRREALQAVLDGADRDRLVRFVAVRLLDLAEERHTPDRQGRPRLEELGHGAALFLGRAGMMVPGAGPALWKVRVELAVPWVYWGAVQRAVLGMRQKTD